MDENPRIADLRKKLEKDPASRLFAQLAEELRKDGKLDEAIAVAQTGLEKNPNYPSARLTLARALLDSGRPHEARPELEEIVKASPDNILASRLLGEALDDLGESAQAVQQFERTLKLAPGDATLLERTGELRRKLAPPPLAPTPSPSPPASHPSAPRIPAPEPSTTAVRPAVVAPSRAAGPPAAPRPAPLPSLSSRPPTPPQAPAPPAEAKARVAPAPIALDRDLASGTFSPGMLSAEEIQRHFAKAAAPAHAPPPPPLVARTETPRKPTPFTPPPVAAPPKVALPPPPVAEEAYSTELLPLDQDLGGQTLPLSSLTLADLYLQQGLKAEASAVLSQVLREEPENAQAKSRFAAVSDQLAQTPSESLEPFEETETPATLPWSMAAPFPAEPAPASMLGAPPLREVLQHVPEDSRPAAALSPEVLPSLATREQIRDRSILSLTAFLSAAEREALEQRAAKPWGSDVGLAEHFQVQTGARTP